MKWLSLTDGEQVALKTLVACAAFLLLAVTACACMVLKVSVDAAFLWPMITLIAAFAGISAATFAQFRNTDYGAIERKGEAAAKVAAASCPQQPPAENKG